MRFFTLANEPEKDLAMQVATSPSIEFRPSLVYKRWKIISVVNDPTLRLEDLDMYILFHSPSHSTKTTRSTSLPDRIVHLATSSSTSPPTPIKRMLIYFWISVTALFLSFFILFCGR